jgi:serine/threonine-protein kinase RsbW
MTRTRSFSREPQSIAAARRFATEALEGIPSETLDAVELMVSELATNSIRHANTAYEVAVTRARQTIRVEVTDDAGGTPAMRSPGPDEPTGRGLRIIEMLSDAWGVEQRKASGKTVWFRLTVPVEIPAA